MSQTEELERRITAAMDRIGQGLAALQAAPAADTGDVDALKQALEDEKLVSAQLEERVRALKAKQDAELAEARSQSDGARSQMGKLDHEVQRLRKANDQLRESVSALREANEAGVGEPHLINKAMLAELEGLRAARAVDIAEADAILSGLAPLLNDAAQNSESEAV